MMMIMKVMMAVMLMMIMREKKVMIIMMVMMINCDAALMSQESITSFKCIYKACCAIYRYIYI